MTADNSFSWNPRAHQPHRTLSRRQRNIEYLAHLGHHWRMLLFSLGGAPAVLRCYRKRLKGLFRPGFVMPRGFGVSTDSEPRLLERMPEEAASLGAQTVLVRVSAWDLDHLPLVRDFLSAVRDAGRDTVVALLQDRRSVLEASYWRRAVDRVFGALDGVNEWYEVGHAWNRMKWGVRHFEEYLDMVAAASAAAAGHPAIRLVGPAVIDFEYICTMGVLFHPRRRPGFGAVSSLLYVDRRGAPENKQNGFDLPHKALLMRAATDASLGPGVPFWITETNWPLAVPGEYSPTSMAEAVDAERHADYLVRYYLLTLASGLVDRVYWWQVAAHGYGLVDDLDGRWDRRPAWRAFRAMTGLLAGATLEGAEVGRRRVMTFRAADGKRIRAAWAAGAGEEMAIGPETAAVVGRDGGEAPLPRGGRLALGSSPVYLVGS